MRKHFTWQTTRKALTATALAAMVTGGAFLTGGVASASTTLADGCAGSVSGNIGDQIAVQGKSLSEIVRTAAKTQEALLHLNGVDPDALATAIASKGALRVGEIPNAAGGSIGGDVIAGVTAQALQNASGLGGGLLGNQAATLQAIRADVTKNCGLTTLTANYVPPTSSHGDGSPAGGNTTHVTPVMPATGAVTAPPRDYSGIPAAVPGGFAVPPGVKYPADSPLPPQQSPEFGVLGAAGSQPADIRNTGNADTLASPVTSRDVQLPMLFAVMALSGVTAALVRSWTLNKVG